MIPKNELTDSVKENLKSKLATPIYGVFVVSWCVFHWQLIYTAIFVDQDRIWEFTGLLKNDYLVYKFFNFQDPVFYILWVLPFLFTILFIWFFPDWFGLRAFEKDADYKTAKRLIQIRAERNIEKAKVETLEVVTKRTQKEKEVKETEKEINRIDPPTGWDEEYINFKTSPLYYKFKFILTSLYENSGKIKVFNDYGTKVFEIPTNLLVYTDTNDLITLIDSKSRIEPTEKGKYFIKKFSLDNPI